MQHANYQRGRAPVRPARALSLRLPLLIFLSLAMIVLSRLGHSTVTNLRAEAHALTAPLLTAALVPLDPARRLLRQVQASYEGFADLERLRDENQRLRQWEGRARTLERKVGELAGLAQALEESRIAYRTARVIARSSGAFVQSALLEGGTDAGIKTGLPVINAEGVLGRVVEAGRRTSRVLLLTDISSRIPVFVGTRQIRAVLAGDNGPEPRLLFLPPTAIVAKGDEITTSGVGGIFPRDLRIGQVLKGGTEPRVSLDAEIGHIEYASVLLYDNPGAMLSAELHQIQREAARARRSKRGDRP